MENQINLSFYQIMMFVIELSKKKKENPNLNDSIANMFMKQMLYRAVELDFKCSKFILKFKGLFKPYTINSSMYNYLVNFTGVDPLDKKQYNSYIPKIKSLEEDILKSLSLKEDKICREKVKTKKIAISNKSK